MFGILFGWRKASKCKKLVEQALCRLKMLKKKRYSIARQLREDLFELISNGYQQIAFNRVEQLVRDESLMEAYDLIENFCEFILVKFSHVRKNKTCPDDLMEAISSLIFASARCGDFPELKPVRKFFEERYGQRFAMAAVELHPENLVNPQIKEKLAMKAVSDDEKQRLMNEIARDCFHPAILALEYCPDWYQEHGLDRTDDRLSYEVTIGYLIDKQQPYYVHSECRTDDHVDSIRSPTINRLDYDWNDEFVFDSYSIGSIVYNVFVYPHWQPDENKYPRHVHPKLPDYDEIAGKFIGMKREYAKKM
ncbi:uncharacterized protein LOC111455514 [Cucurbita moschata]|uniref:Uncharacterized protein LOC111455514 n=1 Tax=Cucurbita moschata TaxID=3662 RepID=A0A6J1GM59_CUCMO|nr:uncharacterized protein LOC111455514 [Cucurbita moschata]